jgi:hypothetical protein
MTNLYNLDLAHLVVVTYENHGPTLVFRAECTCGWSGDGHDDNALAELDADDHHTIAVGPADGLDAAISGLLDLQDDLAAAVMWLAEHWSPDLPVPGSRGVGADPAGVDLAVCCTSFDQLARIARVLDAPVVDDPAPDTAGNRYRRTERRFGWVRLFAYRSLSDIDQAAA